MCTLRSDVRVYVLLQMWHACVFVVAVVAVLVVVVVESSARGSVGGGVDVDVDGRGHPVVVGGAIRQRGKVKYYEVSLFSNLCSAAVYGFSQ